MDGNSKLLLRPGAGCVDTYTGQSLTLRLALPAGATAGSESWSSARWSTLASALIDYSTEQGASSALTPTAAATILRSHLGLSAALGVYSYDRLAEAAHDSATVGLLLTTVQLGALAHQLEELEQALRVQPSAATAPSTVPAAPPTPPAAPPAMPPPPAAACDALGSNAFQEVWRRTTCHRPHAPARTALAHRLAASSYRRGALTLSPCCAHPTGACAHHHRAPRCCRLAVQSRRWDAGLLASAALLEGLAGIERFSAAEVDGLLRALSHSNDLIAEIASEAVTVAGRGSGGVVRERAASSASTIPSPRPPTWPTDTSSSGCRRRPARPTSPHSMTTPRGRMRVRRPVPSREHPPPAPAIELRLPPPFLPTPLLTSRCAPFHRLTRRSRAPAPTAARSVSSRVVSSRISRPRAPAMPPYFPDSATASAIGESSTADDSRRPDRGMA